MKIENKYIVIKTKDGDVHVSEYVRNARIETTNEIFIYDSLQEVDVSILPILKEGQEQESNKIYNINGVASCNIS